jgi:hypothetical protein
MFSEGEKNLLENHSILLTKCEGWIMSLHFDLKKLEVIKNMNLEIISIDCDDFQWVHVKVRRIN